MIDIETFINNLRESDEYIPTIFMQGSCYKFHKLLKSLYPESVPLINKNKDHIVTLYRFKMWDINGEVKSDGWYYLTDMDYNLVGSWSFSKNKYLSLGECPCCEEPLLV